MPRLRACGLVGALIVGAAALIATGCQKPCEKLAAKTCDELGEGSVCTVARFRAAKPSADQLACKEELKAWPRTLARLKSSQAAINQLDRIAPGATRIKVLPVGKDGGRPHRPHGLVPSPAEPHGHGEPAGSGEPHGHGEPAGSGEPPRPVQPPGPDPPPPPGSPTGAGESRETPVGD